MKAISMRNNLVYVRRQLNVHNECTSKTVFAVRVKREFVVM